MSDCENPAAWWRLMLKAIVGLQVRSTTSAREYVAFVAKHRGAEAAERAKAEVKRYANSARFADGAKGGSAEELLAKLG